MNEEVKYTLTLNDLLTGKLKGADTAAKGLEVTMGTLASIAGGFLSAFATVDFLKGSIDQFNQAEQASAQLNATLASTKNIAGLNREALDKQAESIMNQSLFDDDDITRAQSLVATFTNIRGAVYNDAIPAIADLATKMGGDIQGASIQVGKALNDPVKGIAALSRVGVSFSEDQKKVIETLAKTGHLAEAQGMILKELNTEFGGSAAAAAAAGTGGFTVLQHQMGNVREELGGVLVEIGTELMPVFRGMVTGFQASVTVFKDVVHWIKEHSVFMTSLAKGIALATGAYVAYIAQQKLAAMWTATLGVRTAALAAGELILGTATAVATGEIGLMEGAMGALNLVMSLNPVGAIITGIAALAAGLIYAYNKSEVFRGAVWSLWEVIKTVGGLIKEYWTGVFHVVYGAMAFDKSLVMKGFSEMAASTFGAGEKIAKAAVSGYEAGVKDFRSVEIKGGVLANQPKQGKGAVVPLPGEPGAAGKAAPTGATPNKAVTINISIGKLVETMKINTTTINESAEKVKQVVMESLLSAVNDSQIVSGI